MKVVGIDEVGRGSWAGPLVAGAVMLDDSFMGPVNNDWRLADSKLMTKLQRKLAHDHITQQAQAYGLGWVSNYELDEIGLTAAVRLAMQRALAALAAMYDQRRGSVDSKNEAGSESAEAFGAVNLKSYSFAERIIIDGAFNFLAELPHAETIVKADGLIPAVSAASIVAKVARDTWMEQEAETQYPGYGFARHVGYGTKAHRQALATLGTCELHRRSFRPIAALC